MLLSERTPANQCAEHPQVDRAPAQRDPRSSDAALADAAAALRAAEEVLVLGQEIRPLNQDLDKLIYAIFRL